MGLCTATRAQCLALRATLPATWMTLFSSVSFLQVCQMGLFPCACCWFALVRNSTAWRVSRTLATVLVSMITAEQKAPTVWLKLTRVCGTSAPPSKLTILHLRAHQSAVLPPSHQQVQVAIATVSLCRKNALPLAQRAARPSWSATASTTQICHFDGYTHADTGLQFPSCVTTTLLQCSDSTIAQNEKLDAPDCTNSTVGESCVVGCAAGYELASGDSLRARTCVSENESVAFLTGSLHACQGTPAQTLCRLE